MGNLLNPMSVRDIAASCSTMSRTAITLIPRPESRSARFSKGNMIYTGKKQRTLAMKTRRGPRRPTISGKAVNWKMPFMNPYPAIHKPIDAGLMPSPPSSTEVDQMSGMRATAVISRRPIMP